MIRPLADLVELKQLGLNPLNPPKLRFSDAAKEDSFCQELRKIGAKWWPSERRFRDVWSGDWDEVQPTEEELKLVWFGWPADGGLLVLECENSESPEDIGRLRMATNMEERCKILTEAFMARFYQDPTTYDGLRNT